MAYRIQLAGSVIEADTATEVQELLVIMATPLPRQLAAGLLPPVYSNDELHEEAKVRKGMARRKAAKKSRRGGGRG